jgi:hypothetical protein
MPRRGVRSRAATRERDVSGDARPTRPTAICGSDADHNRRTRTASTIACSGHGRAATMRDFDLRHSGFRGKGIESRRGRKRLIYSTCVTSSGRCRESESSVFATRIGLGAPSARRRQGARNAHPAGLSGPSHFIHNAFCDGPTRRIGVIITRFRLIGLVFSDRS